MYYSESYSYTKDVITKFIASTSVLNMGSTW